MTDVDKTIVGFDAQARARAQDLRRMIHDAAAHLTVPISESLKWGQPSFATPGGTPLRLGPIDGGLSVFVHCQTTVIHEMAARFPNLRLRGSRAFELPHAEPLPTAPLQRMITRALTYKSGPALEDLQP